MINIIYAVLGFIVVIYGINKICETIQKFTFDRKEIMTLFEYFESVAYDCIYESDLIGYVSNGITNIPVKDRENLERNFIKQCIMYMGDVNRQLFLKFYGSEQTMITNMIRYMRKRFNEDGLTKIIKDIQPGT